MRSISDDPNRHVSDDDGGVILEGSELFGNRPMPATIVAIDAEEIRGAIETLYPDAKSDKKTLQLKPLCDVAITLSTDELVGSKEISKQGAGVVYVTKNSSMIAMIQPDGNELAVQLPPGEYTLVTYFANSNPGQYAITVPEEASYAAEPIVLEPSPLSLLFGKPAPPLREIADWHGEDPGTLESLHGNVVILDFWGYWCGPCIGAMPALMDLHDEYSNKGLKIIGVHDGTVSTAKQLIEQTKLARDGSWQGRALPFPTAIAGGGTAPVEGTEANANGQVISDYKINAFPTTLLIDKNGTLFGQISVHDIEGTKRTIEEHLAKPGPQIQ